MSLSVNGTFEVGGGANASVFLFVFALWSGFCYIIYVGPKLYVYVA